MQITVQLFASLAEAAGTRAVCLQDLPDPATTGEVGQALFARFPALAPMRESVIYAVNAEYVQADYPVRPGDEVALIPPVSGGGGGGAYFQITAQPLDLGALHDLVRRDESGAVALFSGVVRNTNLGRAVDHLVYDAYEAMATKVMRRIAAEIRERWTVSAIAMHHRIGRLEIGEASVVIAVAAPHRREAIEGCQYGIDRLKAIVPIWKKEVWTDGAHWVEGSLTPQREARSEPAPSPAPAPPSG